MFGNNGPAPATPARPKASDVARIDGTLTQVIMGDDPTDSHVFINGVAVPAGDLDSLTVEIAPPIDGAQGTISAVAALYQASVSTDGGNRPVQTKSLFPGTVDIVAAGRRVVISCRQLNSFDDIWLGVGTRLDGSITEVSGVRSFRLAVTPTFVDASLTWSDTGISESLLTSG